MISLNIFLIKDSFNTELRYYSENGTVKENINSIFNSNICLANQIDEINHIKQLKREPKIIYKADSDKLIYYRNKEESRPEWAKYWQLKENIFQRTANSIVILKVKDKRFVICHGHSTGLINPYAKESRFGLITSLNMIDKEKINSTDTLIPSEITLQERKKTVGTDIADFNIKRLSSILKNISGNVKQEYSELIKSVVGSDNIKFSIPFTCSFNELQGKISVLLERFKAKDYKDDFDWVDNFLPVGDKTLVQVLDETLIDALNHRDDSVRILIPSNLNYSGYLSYKLSGFDYRESHCYDDNDVMTHIYSLLISSDKKYDNINELKKPEITLVEFGNIKNEIDHYSFYKSIYFEIHDKDVWYFIESGQWYEVSKDYTAVLDEQLSEYLSKTIEFKKKYDQKELCEKYRDPQSNHNSFENWYNKELVKELKSKGDTALLDADNLIFKDQSKIEICDILHTSDEYGKLLVHVKYNRGASCLSHLFFQGLTSSTLLKKSKFRELVNSEKIENEKLKFIETKEFDSREYTLVYGIIRKKKSKENIPLFSRVTLRQSIENLEAMGFDVKLSFIDDITKPGCTTRKKRS